MNLLVSDKIKKHMSCHFRWSLSWWLLGSWSVFLNNFRPEPSPSTSQEANESGLECNFYSFAKFYSEIKRMGEKFAIRIFYISNVKVIFRHGS